MPTSETDPERTVGRLVTFTDAVVAIAITLIVLPLVEAARELGPQPAAVYLGDEALNILAAALSFLVIATFWKQHHRMYKRVTGSSRGLVNANLLWLAGIIFLPVPTVLIVGYPGNDPVAAGIYIGTILVSQVALRIQQNILVTEHLFTPGAGPLRGYLWPGWIVVGLTVAAFTLSMILPNLGPSSLLLLLLSSPLNWLVRRRWPAEARKRRML